MRSWLLALAACGGDPSPPDVAIDDAPHAGGELPPTAQIQVAPLNSQFGDVGVGATSPTMNSAVTNVGAAPTSTLGATLMGVDAGMFAIATDTCTGTSLAPGASCVIGTVFKPTVTGVRAASLLVSAQDGGAVSTSLDGTGVAPATLALAQSDTALPSVAVGSIGTDALAFTATNTGEALTGLLDVRVAGANPADFIVDDHCSFHSLATGASCDFAVRFAPLARGHRAATLEVSAGPGGFVSGVASATGLAPAQLATPYVHRDVGTVTAPATAAIAVQNLGEVATVPLALVFAGGGGFTDAGGTCSGALAPGATCTQTVAFDAAATNTGQLQVLADDDRAIVTFTGTVAGNALAPAQVAFPPTQVGTSSATQTVTLTNHTAFQTDVLTATSADPAFAIAADTCSGAPLVAGASCHVDVRFAPSARGPRAATLAIGSPFDGTFTTALTGLALGPARLVVSPPALDLGTTFVGAVAAGSLLVENVGDLPSAVPAITGTSSELVVAHDCTTALAPHAACSISVRFAPTTAGARTGQVTGAVTANLAANAIAPSGFAIAPPHFEYAATAAGTSGRTQLFTIRNVGAVPAQPTPVVAGPFAIASNSCAMQLLPGGSCVVGVTFQPIAAGASTGGIAAGSTVTALAGTGLAPLEVTAIDSAPVAALAHEFGSVQVGATADTYVSVRDNAAQALLAVTLAAPFSVVGSDCALVLHPGRACTVRVRFAPTTTGPASTTAVLAIPSATLQLELKGSGR